jgi:tetratricopeptide (TPR) repeat protein
MASSKKKTTTESTKSLSIGLWQIQNSEQTWPAHVRVYKNFAEWSAAIKGGECDVYGMATAGALSSDLSQLSSAIEQAEIVRTGAPIPAFDWKGLFSGQDRDASLCRMALLQPDAAMAFIQEGYPPQSEEDLCFALDQLTFRVQVAETGTATSAAPFIGGLRNRFIQRLRHLRALDGNLHRAGFWALALILMSLMLNMSRQAAISGDEFTQYEYSKLTANYLLDKVGMEMPIDTMALKGQKMNSLARAFPQEGARTATLVDPERLMHLYGSSFDTFTTLLGHALKVDDIMEFRHWWNALFGFFTVLFGALLIRQATGGSWKYAWIGLLLLFFTPRLLGEALNNPKDIPFALGYVASLYYAVRFFRQYPRVKPGTAVGLVLFTALGISIRIGGLLSIAIIGLYGVLAYIRRIELGAFLRLKWTGGLRWIYGLGLFALLSYLIGIYPWPYGWDAPFSNPFKALEAFTNYQGSIRQLFAGTIYDSNMLPRTYLMQYVAITLPLVSLIGFALFLVFWARKWKNSPVQGLILFAAIFPIAYIFYNQSQVYGGLRQILFTIPLFVAGAVIGFWSLERVIKARWAAFAIPGLALIGCSLPASFVAQNHPLSYVYFNETVGGTEGAYGQYEMDYYLASLRPSSEWFLENVARKNPTKKYTVLTYGMDQVKYYMRHDSNVHVGYTRFDDRAGKDWDYAIFYNAYFDEARLNNELPVWGTVYSPEVDGKPMGWVIERKSREDLKGIQAVMGGRYAEGIEHFKAYHQLDARNSETHFYQGMAYANSGKMDSAIACMETSLTLFPEYTKALFAKAEFHGGLRQFDQAIACMNTYLDSRPGDAEGYYMRAAYEASSGKYDESLSSLTTSMKLNPLDARIYQLGAQIYGAKGDSYNNKQWGTAGSLSSATTAGEQQACIQAIAIVYETATGEVLDLKKYGLAQ